MIRFYTYLLKCKGNTYYVGKGYGSRWKNSMRTRKGVKLLLKCFAESEDEALDVEDEIWCEMTRVGYKLRNEIRPRKGGGLSIQYMSEDTRKKKSIATKLQYKRMTKEQKVEANRKRSESLQEAFASRPEYLERERAANIRAGSAAMSFEAKENRRQRIKVAHKKRREATRAKLVEKAKSFVVSYRGVVKTPYEWSLELKMKVETILKHLKPNQVGSEEVLAFLFARRVSNRLLEYDNRVQSIKEWSTQTGLTIERIRNRLRKGWNSERVLTTPLKGTNA